MSEHFRWQRALVGGDQLTSKLVARFYELHYVKATRDRVEGTYTGLKSRKFTVHAIYNRPALRRRVNRSASVGISLTSAWPSFAFRQYSLTKRLAEQAWPSRRLVCPVIKPPPDLLFCVVATCQKCTPPDHDSG
ncbi:unnamed protein product [Protopolystoma xenopodis]|uniref:Uncharacterized protein n=1 Tax=Protopolystoma xenopodis TaxID=117903 RepID=A0A3S5ACC6_9PLAT|nr:unnamed protein product [Protopolystoma xenopodis]